MKIEDAFCINCKPSNNTSFLIASKYGHICIIRLEPYVSSWDLTYLTYISNLSNLLNAYRLFISIYTKRFDQLSFCFSVNLDLDFFWSILLGISTEHFKAWYVWCCVFKFNSSELSSNLNEFFICLQVSWNLADKTEFFVYFKTAKAEIEISCCGKLSLIVIWSRIRKMFPKENTLVFLIIDVLERQQRHKAVSWTFYSFLILNINPFFRCDSFLIGLNIIHGMWISSSTEHGFFGRMGNLETV